VAARQGRPRLFAGKRAVLVERLGGIAWEFIQRLQEPDAAQIE